MNLIKKSSTNCDTNGFVKLFSNVRNERVRLPYFLSYYRERGISQFYIIDNNSCDGTLEYLEKQEDVTLFFTDESFLENKCGLVWLDQMRDQYADGSWCLTVDCDELLVFPYSEYLNIPSLCEYLDAQNYQGLFTLMMDCYADKSIKEYRYQSGEDFLNSCPYIDSSGYYLTRSDQFPYFGVFGGPRYRGFYQGQVEQQGPTLRKIPLVKWNGDVEYISVTHSTTPIRLADISGALLHFKYLEDFTMHVQGEVARNDRQMSYYKQYLSAIEKKPDLNLFGDVSVKYENSGQLAKLGLIRSSIQYLNWADTVLEQVTGLSKPEVWELRKDAKADNGFNERQENVELSSYMRMWVDTTSPMPSRKTFEVSVIIPVYNAERLLIRSIKSALNQPEVKEILLIDDGSTDASIALCRRYATKHECIKLFQHPDCGNHGAGASRNLGISKAESEIIAFLDADDYYLPGRFSKHKLALLEDDSVDGVYGAQNFEFATNELKLARQQAELPMITSLSSVIEPDQLFVKMNPVGKKGNFHCNALTIRKRVFDEVGGFWDLRTEDIQMWMKIAYSSKLVGVALGSPISTKYIHDGNRMNPSTTREHRPLVFKSLIEFAASKKDQYAKLSRLLERYFSILQHLHYSHMSETDRNKEALNDLSEVIGILFHRIEKYRYVLSKIGTVTKLFSDTDMHQIIDTQFREQSEGLQLILENLDIKDYSVSKTVLEQYFKALSQLLTNKGVDTASLPSIDDQLMQVVKLLGHKSGKYQHLLSKIGLETGLFENQQLQNAIALSDQ